VFSMVRPPSVVPDSDKLVTLITGKWCRLLFTGDDDKVFMTKSLNIMPKQQNSTVLYAVVNLKLQ